VLSRPSDRYERAGLPVPVGHAGEPTFRRWCATAAAVMLPSKVNLRDLHPLARAEIQRGTARHAAGRRERRELAPLQRLVDYARDRALSSLAGLSQDDADLREAIGREGALGPLYVSPAETRDSGYILTGHFGWKLSNRSGRIDLAACPSGGCGTCSGTTSPACCGPLAARAAGAPSTRCGGPAWS
jgi:hypothetical protein